MFKIYKRTIRIGAPEQIQRLASTESYTQETTISQRISNILAIPAMIAGAILGTLVFSVFFAVLLIPLGIIAFRAWRLMKNARQQTSDQSITAEYTVVDDADNK